VSIPLSSSDIKHTSFTTRYVNKDREKTKRIVQHAEKRGIKGLFITVDAPQLGRREKVNFDVAYAASVLITVYRI
jgi:isopentenyl diphosphate isomerase/L-lactate dehydrogenase-like FMN-dependent dehydrogenase